MTLRVGSRFIFNERQLFSYLVDHSVHESVTGWLFGVCWCVVVITFKDNHRDLPPYLFQFQLRAAAVCQRYIKYELNTCSLYIIVLLRIAEDIFTLPIQKIRLFLKTLVQISYEQDSPNFGDSASEHFAVALLAYLTIKVCLMGFYSGLDASSSAENHRCSSLGFFLRGGGRGGLYDETITN